MVSDNNKIIAKNTLLLYFRMILVMVITLYTNRIVLNRLGVNDYGIYNVVGGIVTVFTILSASLTSAISRFLTFELGSNNEKRLSIVFSTSMLIQGLLGLFVVILVETIGVWFLNHKMNISPERIVSANWVLQSSALTLMINMLSVPYNAVIIAHERMHAFAYISLLEVTLKLGIAFLLYITWFDSLSVYAVLIALTAIVIRIAYNIYCRKHFSECELKWVFDRNLIKDMLTYSGWNFLGTSSAILRDQGVNIVINIFCGTAVNAARGIAMQVYGAVHSFSQNFILAVNPQIIKSYAQGNYTYMVNLSFRSARFSYFLLFCLSLPIILQMHWLLKLWLGEVPEFTSVFAIWVLIFGLIESISIPLLYINQATGKIKTYQITVGGLQMLNFPISYLLLWLRQPPYSVFELAVLISLICLFARLIILHRTVGLSIYDFYRQVLQKIINVTIIGIIIPIGMLIFWSPETTLKRIILIMVTFMIACLSSLFIGCSKSERTYIQNKMFLLINKIRNA